VSSSKSSGFSRRGFLRGVGISGGVLGSGVLETETAAAPAVPVSGPDAVTITLKVNGKPMRVEVEPRETLLDVLRNKSDHTAAKRVCDRGTCGACTVILNNKAVYACTVLAIDAQGRDVQTLEGIAQGDKPHPLVAAFVNHDGQQCGYCTPGFVVASKAFLDRNPNPTAADLKNGLGGNLCRCGTYVGVREAVLETAKQMKGGQNA
jgi:xanthine dehydrogenase YagT iron-sulfur-binding subunit